MAINIFAAGRQIVDGGNEAFARGYDQVDKFAQDRARRTAGSALASGDRQGAMNALGGEGDLGAVRQLKGDQAGEKQAAMAAARQGRQDLDADAKRRAEILKDVANGLKSVPTGERKKALQGVYPLFQQSGVDPAMFDPLTEDQLTDAQLDVFTGEVDKLVTVNRGGGGYDVVNPRTGESVRSVEPTQRAPTGMEYGEDGSLRPVPGYVQGRAAIAGATRAPARPRAGGKPAASGPIPTGRHY